MVLNCFTELTLHGVRRGVIAWARSDFGGFYQSTIENWSKQKQLYHTVM